MIGKVVDFFIPLKSRLHKDHLRRSRVSVLVNFVGIAYGLFSLLVFYSARFRIGIITSSLLLAGLTLALLLFRAGINKYIIGNVMSVCMVSVISIFCFYTGGLSSPGITLFALIPMIALLMVDRLNGMIWCFIASGVVISFYILQLLNFPAHKLADRAVENYIYLSTSIGFIFLLFFIIRLSQQSEKKANKELAEKNAALDQSYSDLKNTQALLVQSEKMASLGQLTAGLAHEINNPVNFVSANISSLKRDIEEIMKLLEKYAGLHEDKSNQKLEEILKFRNEMNLNYTIEEIKSLIRGIEEGSKRTTEIVKGLRNFSRLDEDVIKKGNINQGLESTLFLLQNKLNEKNIEIITSLSELPEIDCYPGQLNQVFMNLLTNAIDAIGTNGKIFISTALAGNQVKISIRDTGEGMSDEVKKKLFDPFFTTKDVGKGTGLGLSISYGIIDKHKGKIEVKSEEGGGTEFMILLPISL